MNKVKDSYIQRNILRKKNEYQAAILQDNILSSKQLDEVIKMHQSTVWHVPYSWNLGEDVLEWNKIIEYTDILPDYYEEIIDVSVKKKELDSYLSIREFNKDYVFSKEIFSNILYDAFGRFSNYPSKGYPSAGGLYPVIPIVYIFDEVTIEGVSKGVYVYDSTEMQLLMIKDLSNSDSFQSVTNNINSVSPGEVLSNIAFGYALDMKRATTKYKRRGYRHGLIEVGLMAQSLRESIFNQRAMLGDVSWSGFNDNALSHASGLNARISPIILIQWIGKKI